MCRSDAGHPPHLQSSPTGTYGDSHQAAAQQQQPNLPDRIRRALNLDRCLSVFLLDWDDTLFPTTALVAQGPERIRDALSTIDSAVADLLTSTLDVPNSQVVILTNANLSWVRHAVESFMPKVRSLFEKHALFAEESQLRLISAHRDRAELPQEGSAAYEDAIRRSKSVAVQSIAARLQALAAKQSAQSVQVIGVGDQPHDLAAAHVLGSLLSAEECFVKTVMMKLKPTGVELSRQLAALSRSLPKLMSCARSFHQSMHAAPAQAASHAMPQKARQQALPARDVLRDVPTPTKNMLSSGRTDAPDSPSIEESSNNAVGLDKLTAGDVRMTVACAC
jgi:hypothetical protein